ncbi:MAG: methyltransferase domain-containing protein [Myxococcales bacterium]|nr:methyltransferase domain-containing protein [Myxococcales bacterium]
MSALDDLTDDALTGGFRVFQRRRGHRYSLDDCVTAWEAGMLFPGAATEPTTGATPACSSEPGEAWARDARQERSDQGGPACPPGRAAAPASIVDLGCGIGSVLLMLAYKFPRARLIGIEAQEESHALALRNVARNGVARRVTLLQADLRSEALAAQLGGARHDLVTGTPPYQPVGRGTISPDSQRAHARVELRGGVEDYVRAAARLLAPDGHVVVCGDARAPERLYQSAASAGLRVVSERKVWPAARYKAPLFCVWTLAWPRGTTAELAGPPPRSGVGDGRDRVRHRSFVARDHAGARTPEAHALRAFFDLSISAQEPNSPRQRQRAQGVVGQHVPAILLDRRGRPE